jgi:alkanesulfonate monooxygenase SsuD/methylene tetrahydromethanopterin reductase-like flavin-dependent oxidoreductase (luciferase family)
MPLSNAEKQRRWREKRNRLARALAGTPDQVAEHIVTELGIEQARRIARAIDKRVNAAKRQQAALPKNVLGRR